MTKENILVTWDFSQVAGYALQHAAKYAKLLNTGISLLHVIKKEKEELEVNSKLQIVISETEEKYGITPEVLIKEGTIFNAITEVGNEMNAALILMGTHGMKGMQKFTGSWALKVIAGCESPVIVIQEPPKEEPVQHLIFPIDFRNENKQKLVWANYLHRLFGAKIHVLLPKENDKLILKKINHNLLFAKSYFSDHGIDYEITIFDDKGSFVDSTIDFAEKMENSLVMIMTTKNISFQDYVLGADEQKIISNDRGLSVMCINPRQDLSRMQAFA
ncbi:MAG: universal stress protein [Bacteroidales bacterium]|nr:universal stress protein [Bacteroidales bacterium]